jgi:NitT/TauT family transport system ATP-binding protein
MTSSTEMAAEGLGVTERSVTPGPRAPQHEYEFRRVEKRFESVDGTFTAVTDISLAIEQGTFVSIIGPSGCGKSTLLNMSAGLMRPSEGEVLYRGEPIRGINTSVGYMTQQNNLLPWRTLEKNVGIALEIQGVSRSERKERVAEVLHTVGLDGFGRRYPSQLSGGMQKRAAIARTLIYRPDTLLMDEPFGALDAQLRLSLQRELVDIWEHDKKTVLFVTHDLEEAILLSDRVVVFGTKPGRIIHIEDITLPRPRDLVTLRGDSHFTEVWERLWRLLEPQLAGSEA